jgi:hypothetical protein
MITICSRWETAQMPPQIEWQLWRQIKGAFLVDRFNFVPVIPEFERGRLFQYNTMEEALANAEGERVFLEPKGMRSARAIPGGDIVLVIGDTFNDNLALAKDSETYRIATPGRTVLYGSNAAAAALAMRRPQ